MQLSFSLDGTQLLVSVADLAILHDGCRITVVVDVPVVVKPHN